MSLIVENFSSSRPVSAVQFAVIRTLIYFDIFNHPVKEDELYQLAQQRGLSPADISNAAIELRRSGIIQNRDGYYLVNNKFASVDRRKEGEEKARAIMPVAMNYSKKISRFPFVKGIALSGSLSKNYMDEKSDIDYFIVTAKNRMWVARTLLILYKKIFLFNSHKYFCVNYFVSEETLEVPDKNIFTATEISTLIPTYNYDMMTAFARANKWSKNFLPNTPMRGEDYLVPVGSSFRKKFLEKLLSGKAGELLDNYFFRLTLNYWKKKFSHFDETTFDFRLRSRKNVSKHHPLGFQEKVLTTYSRNLEEFMTRHQISHHAESPVYA